MTEEEEFREIYNLDVISIPTNKPMIRQDHDDVIYKNENAKFRAVVEDIKESHEKGQPVLVGTVSIEKSEKLSSILNREGIKHEVLNAKFHEKEAEIIAQAGKFGAVTIATNMAGRGTDIMLGGNSEYLALQEMRKRKVPEELIEQATAFNETEDEAILQARKDFKELKAKYDETIKEEKNKVIAAGGLKIIGTERHESRRIDNQLRGRSGRQGDNGESRFYIGLDDDLMKIFGGDMITNVFNTLGADENIPIQAKMISNAVENAQKRVESRNFSIRKNVLQYDDVMNVQREIIYKQRKEVLDGKNLKDNIISMINDTAEAVVSMYTEHDGINKEGLAQEVRNIFDLDVRDEVNKLKHDELIDFIKEQALKTYEDKENEMDSETMRELERVVMLKVVDQKWMDHIDAMDELKDGIGLRAYGQKNPVDQYRIEGFDMFDEMVANIKVDVVKLILHAQKREEIRREQTVQITKAAQEALNSINIESSNAPTKSVAQDKTNTTVVNNGPKVGRNDSCPCGSRQEI